MIPSHHHGQDRLIYRHRLWREAGLGRATTALIIGWRTARQVCGSSVHDQPSSTDLIAFIQLGQLGSQARGAALGHREQRRQWQRLGDSACGGARDRQSGEAGAEGVGGSSGS